MKCLKLSSTTLFVDVRDKEEVVAESGSLSDHHQQWRTSSFMLLQADEPGLLAWIRVSGTRFFYCAAAQFGAPAAFGRPQACRWFGKKSLLSEENTEVVAATDKINSHFLSELKEVFLTQRRHQSLELTLSFSWVTWSWEFHIDFFFSFLWWELWFCHGRHWGDPTDIFIKILI